MFEVKTSSPTSSGNELLASEGALRAFRSLQASGELLQLPDGLTSNERAYLEAEAAIRGAKYRFDEAQMRGLSPWTARFIRCMGQLFTAPVAALEDIAELEPGASSEVVRRRLTVWKMHLLLLIGQEKEGARIREELLSTPQTESPWHAEYLTLMAMSYFSTSQSKEAVSRHTEAIKYTDRNPEIFFRTLGSSLAQRAALKTSDPNAFQYFSTVLEEALRTRPDPRYALRQHGYRAMVLTQLGETTSAERHWAAGDKLLSAVDFGLPSLERVQFLTLRSLAASLLGNQGDCAKYQKLGLLELEKTAVFDIHAAELDICGILSPFASPTWRSSNIATANREIVRAIDICGEKLGVVTHESVRECYEEAAAFCHLLLTGKNNRPAKDSLGCSRLERDKWKTLAVTFLASYQTSHSFASRVDYFRLIPMFMNELESHGISDGGISESLKKVLGYRPSLIGDVYTLPMADDKCDGSESQKLLSFASTLRQLARKADHAIKESTLVEIARSVAHDIKRPISMIRSAARNLSQSLERRRTPALRDGVSRDSQVHEFRSVLQKSEEQIFDLLEDLVKVGEPLKLTLKPVSVKGLIDGCLNEMTSRGYDDISFTAYVDADTPFLCDRSKLERALLNILENAAQAILVTGGIVSVRASHENGFLTILLSNPSVIPEDALPRIFERFFTSGKPHGSGLGLSITKKIVEAHGGEVSARSSAADGTTFRLEFPTQPRR